MAINFDRLEGQCCGDYRHFFSDDKEKAPGQCRESSPSAVAIATPGVQQKFNSATQKIENVQVVQVQFKSMFPPMPGNDPGCHAFEPYEAVELGGDDVD